MKTDKELWKICMDIYKELYKNAQPSVDFNSITKSGETKKRNWFMNYYLEEAKQQYIIDKHTKRNKLDKRDVRAVQNEVLLGCSPTSCKENCEKDKRIK